MPNPLDYVTKKDILELGLSPSDLQSSYQPSGGGVYHARGAEGTGKTLLLAHMYRKLIDSRMFTPYDAVGNMTFKGKYGDGFTTLKGDDLRAYLWDLTHVPYENKIIIISEIDSEFPARSFTSSEQTEISLRLWHTHKLHNYIFMDSHLGNSTDLIIHLASHYILAPHTPSFKTNTLNFGILDRLNIKAYPNLIARDIIKTMLIYSRRELTENMEMEQSKIRPSLRKKQSKINTSPDNGHDLDLEVEMKEANLLS